ADAALGADFVHEVPLQRVILAEPFDRDDFSVLGLRERYEARTDDLAVQQHGAGAAFAFAASFLCPGQSTILAQHVEQALQWMRVDRCRRAVQRELHARRMVSGVAGISRTSIARWRIALMMAGRGP